MQHARAKIREALRNALTGLQTTRDNVYGTEDLQIGAENTPALFVILGQETADPSTIGRHRRIERSLGISILGVASEGRRGTDDALDRIACEVEAAIAQSHNLGSLVKSIRLESTQSAVDPEVGAGRIQLNFVATYYTEENDPTQVL